MKKLYLPHVFNILTRQEVYALKSLAVGKANEEQQKDGLRVIVEKICGLGNLSFDENSDITAFNEGKRFCAIQIIKAVDLDYEAWDRQHKAASFTNNKK